MRLRLHLHPAEQLNSYIEKSIIFTNSQTQVS